MKIGIIGAGAWGTALACASARSGNNVLLWSYEKSTVDEINNLHVSSALPGVAIPVNVVATNDISAACDSDVWLVVVPAAFFRETLQKFQPFWNAQPMIVCTKGMEPATGKFMSEILDDEFGDKIKGLYGVLSGPQFAGEVGRNVPTGSTLAGPESVLGAGRAALAGLYLQESDDIIGTEICGVGKNAVALMCGYYSINATGENEKALKLTLAWGEVADYGRRVGARIETFLGLCGLGDLFLSATSKTSRNFSAGVAIATGADVKRIGTVEGISALYGLLRRALDMGVSTPTLSEFETILSGQ